MGDVRHGEATEIPGELHPDIPLTPVNLLPLVYNELRTLAGGQLRHERRDHTLQPTALVHEAYMRLARRTNLAFVNRAQFVGIAAREMRRVLVEHARKHKRQKRGGTKIQVPLNEAIVTANQSSVDMVELDDALSSLATRDERSADVAQMRLFGGLSNVEISRVLDITTRTVNRDWCYARAWLFRKLSGDARCD